MTEVPDIEAINLVQRIALLDNGEILTITRMFDTAGDDCEPCDAVSFVAGPDSLGVWYSGATGSYDASSRQ